MNKWRPTISVVFMLTIFLGGICFLKASAKPISGADELLSATPIAYLEEWKRACETTARDVKVLARQPGAVPKYKVTKCQAMYADAKSAVDRCIAFLSQALTRRLNQPVDAADVLQRLFAIEEKVREFLTYSSSHALQQEAPSFDALDRDFLRQQFEHLPKVCQETGAADWARVREELERGRLRDWSEIAAH